MQKLPHPNANFGLAFADRIIAPFVLFALLVLANGVGNASAYLYLVTLLMIWPVLLSTQPGRATFRNPVGIGYAIAFLCVAVAFVGSASNWSDMENLGNFLPVFLFFPALALFSRTARANGAQIFSALALLGATVALASALYDVWWLGRGRAQGFINLTNPFAAVSIMLGFLALTGLLSGRGLWRYIFMLGPVFGITASILAGTRSAPIVALCLSAVFAVFVAIRMPPKGRLILFAGLAVLVLMATALMTVFSDSLRAFRGLDIIYSFVTEGAVPDNSSVVRLELYAGAIRVFSSSPVVGLGWYHHIEAARQYMSPEVAAHVRGWSHFHNDYLNFAALAGIFGLAFYALYLLLPVWGAIRSHADSQYAARLYGTICISGTYAIFGLFDTAFGAELLFCFSPVATAVLLGLCSDGHSSLPTKSARRD